MSATSPTLEDSSDAQNSYISQSVSFGPSGPDSQINLYFYWSVVSVSGPPDDALCHLSVSFGEQVLNNFDISPGIEAQGWQSWHTAIWPPTADPFSSTLRFDLTCDYSASSTHGADVLIDDVMLLSPFAQCAGQQQR
jgi:hypothetical protein